MGKEHFSQRKSIIFEDISLHIFFYCQKSNFFLLYIHHRGEEYFLGMRFFFVSFPCWLSNLDFYFFPQSMVDLPCNFTCFLYFEERLLKDVIINTLFHYFRSPP